MVLITLPAFAQDKPPIEIEADHQLEWLRDQNMYRGSGNVVITQGTTVIRGDTAEAHYDAKTGPSALTTMRVNGNVVITDPDRTMHAEHGTYDVAAQKMVLTGNADVIQPEQKLKADTITAWLDKDTNKLQRAEAVGHVVITRDGKDGLEIAQSNQALYLAGEDKVELTGDVRLTRGSDHMQGEKATIDIKTGHSTLKNDSKGGRVRAVFNPGKSSPMPGISGEVPMVKSKKQFQPASGPFGQVKADSHEK